MGGYELGLLPNADPAVGALVRWGVPDVGTAVEAAIGARATAHAPVTDLGGRHRDRDRYHPDRYDPQADFRPALHA